MKMLERSQMKNLKGGDYEEELPDLEDGDGSRCGVKSGGVWYLVSSKQEAKDEVYVYHRATNWCCASCPSVMQ